MAEYIERENAYKLISEQKEKETGMYSIGRNTGLNIAKSIIHSKEQCPSADVVEVRHGEWMENDLSVWADCPTDGFPVAVCSVCGMKFCDIINNMGYMYNHCPHCGAKMNGKDDNNG